MKHLPRTSPDWPRLVSRTGRVYVVVPGSTLVESPEGERYDRAFVEERCGKLLDAVQVTDQIAAAAQAGDFERAGELGGLLKILRERTNHGR